MLERTLVAQFVLKPSPGISLDKAKNGPNPTWHKAVVFIFLTASSFPLEFLLIWVLQGGATFPVSSIAPSQIPCPLIQDTQSFIYCIYWGPRFPPFLAGGLSHVAEGETENSWTSRCQLPARESQGPLLTCDSLTSTKCTSC